MKAIATRIVWSAVAVLGALFATFGGPYAPNHTLDLVVRGVVLIMCLMLMGQAATSPKGVRAK